MKINAEAIMPVSFTRNTVTAEITRMRVQVIIPGSFRAKTASLSLNFVPMYIKSAAAVNRTILQLEV